MRYRCPYCKADLGADVPNDATCPSCGKQMRFNKRLSREERQRKRSALVRIDREAKAKMAELRATPNPRALYGPRVLIGAVVLLACLGSLLIGMANRHAEKPDPEKPFRRARHELDVLATALERYRFHVGRYPKPERHGLSSLCNDYREKGWIGPYINHLRRDPWQMPYHYGLTGDGTNVTVSLFSSGPDQTAGTADDMFPDAQAFIIGTEWTNGWVSARERVPGVRIYTPQGGSEAQP